jgi:hypothetical protein
MKSASGVLDSLRPLAMTNTARFTLSLRSTDDDGASSEELHARLIWRVIPSDQGHPEKTLFPQQFCLLTHLTKLLVDSLVIAVHHTIRMSSTYGCDSALPAAITSSVVHQRHPDPVS